jgi:phosphoenolpyruvate carboxylase
MKIIDFCIGRTYSILKGYEYNESLNISENQRNEFFIKTINYKVKLLPSKIQFTFSFVKVLFILRVVRYGSVEFSFHISNIIINRANRNIQSIC